MDESHAKIFGRSDITGAKLVFCHLLVESMLGVLDSFDDPVFGHYNLTKFFLAHAVSQIVQSEDAVKTVLTDPRKLFAEGKVDGFVNIFAGIASTTVDDLNAEIGELIEEDKFDHKRDLKSPTWCKSVTGKLVSAYKKGVKRNRVKPIADLFSGYI
jgi:hypothetical protein